ncbi:EAP30-domain-containing protein [Didymella exigua CBS 183.55]|uniref:Vacuolar-sorting protein SNF8 n=1 Tax=Didymella exigua CBS 183.55 TaxID=1150837 RepID=A0A6A5RZK0_9PLEO|nr:EAP30-domain-containing protein [Didymella exigua CBS 183.55]KAF1933033.1 EAP30-domain-containing protein [Didymella exigua CBS 183.55]
MDRRRTPGLSSLSTTRLQTHHYTSHGAKLRSTASQSLETQLSVFQSLVHNFALTHSKEIRANPAFRAEFARMCAALGIDFLASSYTRDTGSKARGKSTKSGEGVSIWASVLGGSVHDFYFNLGVTIVDVCRETRAENGGLISLSDLKTHMARGRLIGSAQHVSDADIEQAVAALAPLGSCFGVVAIGRARLVRSVPKELNTDQATVLEAVQVLGYVTVGMLRDNLGWERPRAVAVVEDLLADSLVWVDCQAGEEEYWSPAFMTGGGKEGRGGVS